MLKKINRVLKLVGLNLVRAKRKAPKSEAQRVKEFVEEFDGPRPVEWQHIPDNTVKPLSDYMGDAEWHNAPAPVGADDHKMTTTEQNDTRFDRPAIPQPNSDNKIGGPTS